MISVVVPTYGRPDRLRSCLVGLEQLHFPDDQYEVIVVDDGGPVPAEAVVAPFRDRLDITLIRQVNAGPAAARNAGAACAKGRFLAFIDDDCVPVPIWLSALASRFRQTPDCLIGGGIVNALPQNAYSTTTDLLTLYTCQYHQRQHDAPLLFAAANLGLPTERFRELGGFSTSFRFAAGEDYDLCYRWQEHGYRTIYAPEAVVYHRHPLTFRAFCRQHFNYGRGLFRFRARIARRSGDQIRLHPAGFYLDLLRFPLRQNLGTRGGLLALLVGVSQTATIVGATREAVSRTRDAC
jgi:GT2 family glycosyltransferase